MKGKISRRILVILFFSLLLFGCDSLFSTPIQKILENPRTYAVKTVTVSGEATQKVLNPLYQYIKML